MRGRRSGLVRRGAAASMLAGALLVALAAGPSFAGAVSTKSAEWLYVQTAPNATLKPLGNQRELLTLIKPAQSVDAFTNRPLRRLASRPLDQFLGSWASSGFKKVPPNAAITVKNGGKNADVMIVKLGVPRLNKHSGHLTYVVAPLRKGAARRSDLGKLVKRGDHKLPRRLGPTTLFIDDANDADLEPIRIDMHSAGLFDADFSAPGWQLTGTAGGTVASDPTFTNFGSVSQPDPDLAPTFKVHNTGVSNFMTAYMNVAPRKGCLDLLYSPHIGGATVTAQDADAGLPPTTIVTGWNAIPVNSGSKC